MLKQVFQWFVYSSADPSKYALTVKSMLVGVLPLLMLVTGTSQGEVNSLVEATSNIVFYGLSFVSSVGIVFGFARKVWITVASFIHR